MVRAALLLWRPIELHWSARGHAGVLACPERASDAMGLGCTSCTLLLAADLAPSSLPGWAEGRGKPSPKAIRARRGWLLSASQHSQLAVSVCPARKLSTPQVSEPPVVLGAGAVAVRAGGWRAGAPAPPTAHGELEAGVSSFDVAWCMPCPATGASKHHDDDSIVLNHGPALPGPAGGRAPSPCCCMMICW